MNLKDHYKSWSVFQRILDNSTRNEITQEDKERKTQTESRVSIPRRLGRFRRRIGLLRHRVLRFFFRLVRRRSLRVAMLQIRRLRVAIPRVMRRLRDAMLGPHHIVSGHLRPPRSSRRPLGRRRRRIARGHRRHLRWNRPRVGANVRIHRSTRSRCLIHALWLRYWPRRRWSISPIRSTHSRSATDYLWLPLFIRRFGCRVLSRWRHKVNEDLSFFSGRPDRRDFCLKTLE